MGRYDELMKKMGSAQDPVAPEDETTMPDSPRNALAGAVNPLLDKYVNANLPDSMQIPQIPTQSAADEKRWAQNLPQAVGMGTMGTVANAEAAPARFGKIIQMGQQDAKGLGSVSVVPTAEELASDAIRGNVKPMQADAVRSGLQEQYGAELAKRKAAAIKDPSQMAAYDSFKQEMANKFRGQ